MHGRRATSKTSSPRWPTSRSTTVRCSSTLTTSRCYSTTSCSSWRRAWIIPVPSTSSRKPATFHLSSRTSGPSRYQHAHLNLFNICCCYWVKIYTIIECLVVWWMLLTLNISSIRCSYCYRCGVAWSVCVSVCLSVGHVYEHCKYSWNDRDSRYCLDAESDGPKWPLLNVGQYPPVGRGSFHRDCLANWKAMRVSGVSCTRTAERI